MLMIGTELIHTKDSKYNLILKREAIAKYMFYMAFENSIEAGYVTEKGFDPLVAGKLGLQYQLRYCCYLLLWKVLCLYISVILPT